MEGFGVLVWIGFISMAAIAMHQKGYSSLAGAGLGLLLGPAGVGIALILTAKQSVVDSRQIEHGIKKKCPDCAELVRPEALKCRCCGHQFQISYTE